MSHNLNSFACKDAAFAVIHPKLLLFFPPPVQQQLVSLSADMKKRGLLFNFLVAFLGIFCCIAFIIIQHYLEENSVKAPGLLLWSHSVVKCAECSLASPR